MSNKVSSLALVLSLTVFSGAQLAFGWGEPGHKIINQAAAQLMKSSAAGFFQANTDNLALLSTTPDLKWKAKATYPKEKGLHFFQIDNYGQSAIQDAFPIGFNAALKKLGQDYIDTNGSNVWRSAQLYKLMVQAFKSQDCEKALQMGGVLGHYIGDLSQPMHDTSDYDGQSIGQHGIHSYFETKLVNAQNQKKLLRNVASAGTLPHSEVEPANLKGDEMDVIAMTYMESKAAYAELPALLVDFETRSNDEDLISHLAPLMGRGAYTLARVWDLAAQRGDTGATPACESQTLSTEQPVWFPLSE